jgi:hypothetical protein
MIKVEWHIVWLVLFSLVMLSSESIAQRYRGPKISNLEFRQESSDRYRVSFNPKRIVGQEKFNFQAFLVDENQELELGKVEDVNGLKQIVILPVALAQKYPGLNGSFKLKLEYSLSNDQSISGFNHTMKSLIFPGWGDYKLRRSKHHAIYGILGYSLLYGAYHFYDLAQTNYDQYLNSLYTNESNKLYKNVQNYQLISLAALASASLVWSIDIIAIQARLVSLKSNLKRARINGEKIDYRLEQTFYGKRANNTFTYLEKNDRLIDTRSDEEREFEVINLLFAKGEYRECIDRLESLKKTIGQDLSMISKATDLITDSKLELQFNSYLEKSEKIKPYLKDSALVYLLKAKSMNLSRSSSMGLQLDISNLRDELFEKGVVVAGLEEWISVFNQEGLRVEIFVEKHNFSPCRKPFKVRYTGSLSTEHDSILLDLSATDCSRERLRKFETNIPIGEKSKFKNTLLKDQLDSRKLRIIEDKDHFEFNVKEDYLVFNVTLAGGKTKPIQHGKWTEVYSNDLNYKVEMMLFRRPALGCKELSYRFRIKGKPSPQDKDIKWTIAEYCGKGDGLFDLPVDLNDKIGDKSLSQYLRDSNSSDGTFKGQISMQQPNKTVIKLNQNKQGLYNFIVKEE